MQKIAPANRHIVISVGTLLAALVSATLACSPTLPGVELTATPVPDMPYPLATFTPFPTPTTTPTVAPVNLPTPEPTSTPLPTATPASPWLSGEIQVFPGPLHYEGDVLSVEIVVHNLDGVGYGRPVTLSIDEEEEYDVSSIPIYHPLLDDHLLLPGAWDTTGQAGRHQLTIRIPITVGEEDKYLTLSTDIDILPAEQRPEQEQNARWRELPIACCNLFHLIGTSAERDIALIANAAERAVTDVENRLGYTVRPFPIVLIDNMWGNGAYATGSEIVIAYLDRPYSGLDLDNLGIVIRHEATHWATHSLNHQTPVILVEGIAVYVAGGHYKPEPIPERAAALVTLELYIPLTDLTDYFRDQQHEIAYLESGALVYYLVDQYGWDAFLELYATDGLEVGGAAWLDQALQQVYGVGLEETEAEFIAWLSEHSPGDQADDLRLTIDLYEAMRTYQMLYAPYHNLPSIDDTLEKNLTFEFIREPTAPENLAIESMLVAAHQALEEGRYADCKNLLDAIIAALNNGNFTKQPIGDYVAITHLLLSLGYEVQQINIDGSLATVQVIQTWPHLETLTLVCIDGVWQLSDG